MVSYKFHVQPKLSGHNKLTATWMCNVRDHLANGSWPCDIAIRTLTLILEPISCCNLETCYTEGHYMAAMTASAPAWLVCHMHNVYDRVPSHISWTTSKMCTTCYERVTVVVGLLHPHYLIFLLRYLWTRSSGLFQIKYELLKPSAN